MPFREDLFAPWVAGFAIAVFAVVIVGCDAPGSRSTVTQPSWSGQAHSIIFDHHMHTKFSDGGRTLRDLAKLAAESGCSAIAFSDHSDSRASYSADYFNALDAARTAHPGLMVFGGLELEMPSYEGREHLGLVVHPRIERQLIADIGLAVESVSSAPESSTGALDQAVLLPLKRTAKASDALLIYNHPSRKDRAEEENLKDHVSWSQYSGKTLHFAGAPGHQRAPEAGDYRPPLLTRHRWDPVVAQIGGTWDQLLDRGLDVWGAIAASDFHGERKDYLPCTFAKTHIAAKDGSYTAVLNALSAGTFWAGHGDVLEDLQLSVEVDINAPLAYPGATVSFVDPDEPPLIRLSVQRGSAGAGLAVTADFISNCASGESERVAIRKLNPAETETSFFLPVASTGIDGRSCYLRARVAATIEGERLMAYTNPVRLVLAM